MKHLLEHGRLICKKCNKLLESCKCPGKKKTYYTVCDDCKKKIISKVKLKLSTEKTNVCDFVDLLDNQLSELKENIKKYPLIKTNLSDIERKVKDNISKQTNSKFKVVVFARNEIQNEFDEKESYKLQERKFKVFYKKWLKDLIVKLNQMKLKVKDIDVKSIVEPFTKLRCDINYSNNK